MISNLVISGIEDFASLTSAIERITPDEVILLVNFEEVANREVGNRGSPLKIFG